MRNSVISTVHLSVHMYPYIYIFHIARINIGIGNGNIKLMNVISIRILNIKLYFFSSMRIKDIRRSTMKNNFFELIKSLNVHLFIYWILNFYYQPIEIIQSNLYSFHLILNYILPFLIPPQNKYQYEISIFLYPLQITVNKTNIHPIRQYTSMLELRTRSGLVSRGKISEQRNVASNERRTNDPGTS